MSNVSFPIYAATVLLTFLFMILAGLFHELGHLIWFKRNKRNAAVKIKPGIKRYWDLDLEVVGDYENMTDEEYKDMYLLGIYAGLIPLIAAVVYNFYFLFLFAVYLYWCKWDFKAWRELNDETARNNN